MHLPREEIRQHVRADPERNGMQKKLVFRFKSPGGSVSTSRRILIVCPRGIFRRSGSAVSITMRCLTVSALRKADWTLLSAVFSFFSSRTSNPNEAISAPGLSCSGANQTPASA